MKATSHQTCWIGLLATFLAAISAQAALASISGLSLSGEGFGYVFQLSSTPLESSRGE
jgi:hypothetical protein